MLNKCSIRYSQFFITLAPCEWLNEKHVVFGRVTRGVNNFKTIEKLGSRSGCPRAIVRITDCGEIKRDYPKTARTPPPIITPPNANRFTFFYSPRGSPRKRVLDEKFSRRQPLLQQRHGKDCEKERISPFDGDDVSTDFNMRVKDD